MWRGTGSVSYAAHVASTPVSPSGPKRFSVGTSAPPTVGAYAAWPASVAAAVTARGARGIPVRSPGRGRARKTAVSPRSAQSRRVASNRPAMSVAAPA